MEIFKQINGFPKYWVSNYGNIRSTKNKKPRILKPAKLTGGYLYIILRKNNKSYTRCIHQLVAQSFIGECPKNKEVNHKDCNKTNNSIDNIEYMTHRDNVLHSFSNGLRKTGDMSGENNPGAKLTWDKIRIIRNKLKSGTSQVTIAHEYKVTKQTIWSIAHNKNWNKK